MTGLGLCAFFFVVGEVYSHCVGNAGRMLSVYGLYYLILFLGTFDWLSDMFFILYDLYVPLHAICILRVPAVPAVPAVPVHLCTCVYA